MFRRRHKFFKSSAIILVCILAIVLVNRYFAKSSTSPRVIVLCIDAMDYKLTNKFMQDGKLPNFEKLAQTGSFVPMQTSMPPLSPVAWTNFITGMNSGGHGVYDFLRRDPSAVGAGFLPQDGVTKYGKTSNDGHKIPFTQYQIPEENALTLLRQAPAFWNLLDGVNSIIYKLPANYPVIDSSAKTMSGMGTPDLLGTYGTYTYLTTDPDDWHLREQDIFRVAIESDRLKLLDGMHGHTDIYLRSPENPFLCPDSQAEEHPDNIPLDIYCDIQNHSVAIILQGRHVVLSQGQWSNWVSVEIGQLPLVHKVKGHVRFYLKQMDRHCKIFISPIQLSPGATGLATAGLDKELQDSCGLSYTKGMSEQTKALTHEIFNEDEYIKQSDMVLAELKKALNHLLENSGFDLLCFYISTIDLDSHVMWKHLDKLHPAHGSDIYARHIEKRYVQMDQLLGKLQSKLRKDDILYVISDHGFESFSRELNMCRWLEREGYLRYKSKIRRKLSKYYQDIDWNQTIAYPVGFNGLFINMQGREACGTVSEHARQMYIEEIRMKLLDLHDSDATKVFVNVYKPEEIYSGQSLINAPDLILGYNAGYGPSDESVEGSWNRKMIRDRMKGFTGQHCMDYRLVPGVCFSSRKLSADHSRMEDMTVTIMKEFDYSASVDMTGNALY